MTATHSPPGVPKLGIILPEGEHDMGGRTARWVDYVDIARTAEAMGFDSLWFVDHLLYQEGATTEPPQGVARYADQWNTWLAMGRSEPDAFPADNALVDTACLEVGRDPATLERTASIMVDMNGRREIPASMGPDRAQPLTGTPDEIADEIRAFATRGVSHLQLYLIPNSVATLRNFELVLRALGRA